MKTVLSIAAAIFILTGIAVGVVSQMDYGTVLIGLNLDLAATLIIGGFVVMGLAGVIGAVNNVSRSSKGASRVSTTHQEAPRNDGPKAPSMGGITAGAAGMGAVAAGAAGAAAGTLSTQMDKAGKGVDSAIDKVAEVAAEAKDKASDVVGDVVTATTETVSEKAGDAATKATDSVDNLFASAKDAAKDKADGAVEAVTDTASDAADAVSDTAKEAVDAVADTADDAKEAAGDAVDAVKDEVAVDTSDEPEQQEASEDPDQLYVVEELLIRDRPARVLSDNTVEAETDEGWMRFENVEHLEEYLDAMKG